MAPKGTHRTTRCTWYQKAHIVPQLNTKYNGRSIERYSCRTYFIYTSFASLQLAHFTIEGNYCLLNLKPTFMPSYLLARLDTVLSIEKRLPSVFMKVRNLSPSKVSSICSPDTVT